MNRGLARCHGCRVSILDTFAALAGVPIAARVRPPFQYPVQPPRRRLNHSALRTDSTRIEPTNPRQSESDTEAPLPATETSQSAVGTASLPWYLQVSTPAPPAPVSPLLALQAIPPLPQNPPDILQPILTHLSDSIGLDNLTLLDLRHLNPPPALGANLIMLLGTARSVKHLNISADRFCRWLRSTYKLRPYADGLLGRNELKLKLRRRARRLKLAQSVGNTVAMDKDDGITTGWICVNVGAVDGAVAVEQAEQQDPVAEGLNDERRDDDNEDVEEEEYENPDSDSVSNAAPTYVGFGSNASSTRIVVQMFTEEKREEMDLEGLWQVRSERRAKKEEKAALLAEERLANEDDILDEQSRRAEGPEKSAGTTT